MEQKPFPKPPPAELLEEEVWIDQTDRAEVGREPFFFGRDAEFEAFQKAANNLRAGRIGDSTMIFQGAPGAGKSALMLESLHAGLLAPAKGPLTQYKFPIPCLGNYLRLQSSSAFQS
ncbi:MAG: hypothetical protein OXI60_07600 [Acidiferrobacterales bacterium]|nr:hypothetical protein [Acidiferrobacterales bacterium]